MNSASTPSKEVGARPPVVVVLGHVDHGKTKLLDVIRKENVIDKESGGITQHIGAYQAEHNGKTITFLDTPGHEAFAAIRSRGAKVADIAILVVAADESVKPQTKEAIRMIKEASLSVIVAINKIDKEGANPQKVKQDLAQEEILVEDWGGQVPAVEISAKQEKGISELLDMVLLVTELQELPEVLSGPANGVVIESHKDVRRGFVATVLVREGLLHVGDWTVVDHVVGKVKSMESFSGTALTEARPAQPVLLTGWPEGPRVGAPFRTAPAKKAAEELAEDAATPPPTPFHTFRQGPDQETPDKQTLNVVFKGDVASSLEAIELSLKEVGNDQVGLRVLASGVGNVSEADVKTAAAKGAIIFGFRVGVEPAATKMAERDGIAIQTFDVIYELIEAVRQALVALLPKETKRTVVGKLKVLAIFKKESRSLILGGKVLSGTVQKGITVDLVQGDEPVRVGKITSLQKEKEDVDEVATGAECGMRIDIAGFDGDIQKSDTLEFVREEEVSQSL